VVRPAPVEGVNVREEIEIPDVQRLVEAAEFALAFDRLLWIPALESRLRRRLLDRRVGRGGHQEERDGDDDERDDCRPDDPQSDVSR